MSTAAGVKLSMPYLSFTMAEAEQQVLNIPVHSMHRPVGAAQDSMPAVRSHNLRYLHLAAQFCLITKRARITRTQLENIFNKLWR